MSGFVGDLSAKQQTALDQFKNNLADVTQPNHDDHFMLRWLRARAWDLRKSERMLRDHLEWRKKNNVDKILVDYTPPEVLVKHFPGGIAGLDKEGYPFWIEVYGYCDLKGLMYSSSKKDIIKYKIYTTEMNYKLLDEQTKKKGLYIDNISIIFDMDKIGMKHLWKPAVDTLTEVLSIVEANYPETLKICYIINAPKIFPIVFNIAKPFLSDDTKKKIRVLGRDWKQKLLNDIDASELPVHWGGTKTGHGGDEFCGHQVCMGGTVDKKYYQKRKEEDMDLTGYISTNVGRGSTLQLDYYVTQPGCILRWNFWTDGKDIKFGVFRRTAEKRQKADAMETVIESDRVNSHMVPEDGSLVCENTGTYVIRFDNTYSYVSSKKLCYHIEVLAPDNTHTDVNDNMANLKM